jgi:hypothetical protein
VRHTRVIVDGWTVAESEPKTAKGVGSAARPLLLTGRRSRGLPNHDEDDGALPRPGRPRTHRLDVLFTSLPSVSHLDQHVSTVPLLYAAVRHDT